MTLDDKIVHSALIFLLLLGTPAIPLSRPISLQGVQEALTSVYAQVKGVEKLTGVSLENLASSLGLVILPLEVEHEDCRNDDDGELSGDGGPKSGSVTGGSIDRPERDTGNDTADTTSADSDISACFEKARQEALTQQRN